MELIYYADVEPATESPAQKQQTPFPRDGDSKEAGCFPLSLIFGDRSYFARSR
jgi:hypothetical protein